MKRLTGGLKKIFPGMPAWSNQMLRPGRKIKSSELPSSTQQVIYFTTCINRMMGGDTGQRFLSVCKKAGVNVIIPGHVEGACCGQIFSSKGFTDAYRLMANKTIEKLWQHSKEGTIPVVLDTTSCTQTFRSGISYLKDINKKRFEKMVFMDSIDFIAKKLLPRLKISSPKESIIFHPVCSVFKMGSLANLQRIGDACSKQATVPVFAKCCGMAGDRGFYYPSLTAAATKTEAGEVKQKDYDGYYSSTRTCEMALSDAVGKNYESILKLVDEVTN